MAQRKKTAIEIGLMTYPNFTPPSTTGQDDGAGRQRRHRQRGRTLCSADHSLTAKPQGTRSIDTQARHALLAPIMPFSLPAANSSPKTPGSVHVRAAIRGGQRGRG